MKRQRDRLKRVEDLKRGGPWWYELLRPGQILALHQLDDEIEEDEFGTVPQIYKSSQVTREMISQEYLTIAELGECLKLSPKTIKNKMASGIFKKGAHYFSPRGIGPRFKWSAIVAWLEGQEQQVAGNGSRGIPMARGYTLE